MNDNNITCQIKRSDRPCLICPGYMDLIEARPPKFNLFGGMSFVCNPEEIDCLDCPQCGYKTTTADYLYLSMCKRDRPEKGRFLNVRMNSHSDRRKSERIIRRCSGQRRENSGIQSSSSSKGRNCSSCQAPLESSSWQFCPKCGQNCSLPNTATSSSSKARVAVNENSVLNQILKDMILSDSASISNDNSPHGSKNREKQIDSKSFENGIVRTVTPPIRTSINNDDRGSVEMQY